MKYLPVAHIVEYRNALPLLYIFHKTIPLYVGNS